MWSNLLSAALLYGLLSTTVVIAQTSTCDLSIPCESLACAEDLRCRDARATASGFPASSSLGSAASSGQTSTQSLGKAVAGTATPTNVISDKGKAGPPSQSSPAPNSSSAEVGGKKSSNTGAIAGGVVGGVLFVVLVGALVFFLRRKKRARDPLGSAEKSADETAPGYEDPTPPPVPIVAARESPQPHHNTAIPNEAHGLMSHYGDAQPQHVPQEVQPVIMPGKPYDLNSSSREIRDGDEDDGISVGGPSPVTTPSPERQQEQQRSVPRLPIYQAGRKDDSGGNTPPPAL